MAYTWLYSKHLEQALNRVGIQYIFVSVMVVEENEE
jgi:hypothetical protein